MSSTLNVKLTCGGDTLAYGLPTKGRIRVAFGSGTSEEAAFQHFTDEAGTVAIELLPPGPYTIYPLAGGYQAPFVWVVMPHDAQIVIDMTRVPEALSPLRRENFHLANDDGRWFGIGASSFLAYQRFLNNEDLTAVFSQLAGLGFNLIRVFGMVDSFSHWHPQEHADYYDRIPDFLDLCASYGFYVQWDAFADTQIVMPNSTDQVNHWNNTCGALKQRTNAFVSVGNELNQHSNAVTARLNPPDGLLASAGSYGGQPDANPPMPTDWALGCFHQRRDYPKAIPDSTVVQLRSGDTVDGKAHPIPIGLDEPPAFGEAAGPSGRWTDPGRAFELAGTAKGTAAWVIYHCDAGILSQLFGPNQTACAVAFVAGGQ